MASNDWVEIKKNPTLYPEALTDVEGEEFDWHSEAFKEHSSQVFCVSAFSSIRNCPAKDKVIPKLFDKGKLAGPWHDPMGWSIELERAQPELLGELGMGKPTSIDCFFESRRCCVAVESKFRTDAEEGFGSCSQVQSGNCAGFFGPGSDKKARHRSLAWCRLEKWDSGRQPRLYWSLGREYFRPEVMSQQVPGNECPFAGPNYQLMRNFLFSGAYATRYSKQAFGVLAICPKAKCQVLVEQIEEFRQHILLPEFHDRIGLATYEDYVEVLRECGGRDAEHLASFLEERIRTLIGI